MRMPVQATRLNFSLMKAQPNRAAKGGARTVSNKARLDPRRLMAAKNMVSPKPMPTAPLTAKTSTETRGRLKYDSPINRLVAMKSSSASRPLSRFSSSGRMVLPRVLNHKEANAHKKAAARAKNSPLKVPMILKKAVMVCTILSAKECVILPYMKGTNARELRLNKDVRLT